MKILFATPECAPYVKTGGLGDVSAALPATLAAMGHEVKLLLPAYRGMQVRGEVGETVPIPAHGHWPGAGLMPVKIENGVTLLLLACDDFYQRAGGPYVDESGHDYADNALRFAFFSRVAASLGTAASPMQGWRADVVHANDWPTALAPFYLSLAREAPFGEPPAASVLTIHNLAFQGMFPMALADTLGIPPHRRGIDGVEFWGQLSLLKAGLQCAHAITTVSPTYAREIQGEPLGAGLDGVLRANGGRLHGILNGIDTRIWNAASDPLLSHRYTPGDLSGKAHCKTALQRRCGLAVNPEAMLFAVVSRLTPQKGIDLVLDMVDEFVAQGAQLVVLGVGEPVLQEALLGAAKRAPSSVAVTLGFDEMLAHQVEAGADCFLMPSRFEPCGLNQMYSQAYGTPPIVSATGGLVDSVVDATVNPPSGTGFIMASQDITGLREACSRARAAFQDKPRWRAIQRNGMARDFGWEPSAARYLEIYRHAIERNMTSITSGTPALRR